MALTMFNCAASLNPKLQGVKTNGFDKVKTLITKKGIPSLTTSPQEALLRGNWVKLICGASFEDVVDVRNLSLVYTLAGVDCIDCAADAAVVSAVNEGIEEATTILPLRRPWVMISVNDDEDLHFRKANFDPDNCPMDCSRPCEMVCPANAISVESKRNGFKGGVISERCYGCGRCFPICPYDKISEISYVRDASATADLLKGDDIDAVEIHTSGRQLVPFKQLWDDLSDSISYLKLVAVLFVSLPNLGESTVSSMNSMYSIMEPKLRCLNLWQLDGRPMSGDIGRGATKEAISFATRLASSTNKPRGFLQLAGGTNAHTVDGLKKERLFQTKSIIEKRKGNMMPLDSLNLPHALIAGVAYGGYARKIVGRVLNTMQSQHGYACIEKYPEHLLAALYEAIDLVGTVKGFTT